MGVNVSGGLWSLLGVAGAAACAWVASHFAGLEMPVTVALVTAVGGVGGTILNTVLTGRLRVEQTKAANAHATDLENHKGTINKLITEQQRVHDGELVRLQSKLKQFEEKESQLRAHSLGLEAERRRNFDARRTEVCAEVYCAVSNGFSKLEDLYFFLEDADEFPVPLSAAPEGRTSALIQSADTAARESAAVVQKNELFLSCDSARAASLATKATRRLYKLVCEDLERDTLTDSEAMKEVGQRLWYLREALQKDMAPTGRTS